MLSKRLWKLIQLSRKIWVRTTLIALLAVVAVAASSFLGRFIPDEIADRLGVEAVLPVLNVLASSMLAVVTFSLSVMVSSFQAASSQVTPRAHRLLLEDTTTQTVLATFLGAFIFALLALVLFRAGFYGGHASVVIFAFTVLVIALVVIAILRWIAHLSRLGSMDETMQMLEDRVRRTMENHRKWPGLGAKCYEDGDKIPTGAVPIPAEEGGYVRHIDVAALQTRAEEEDCRIWLRAIPGDWVGENEALGYLDRASEPVADAVREAYVFSPLRNFDQDPRFGLFVIAEVAERALSPGINDPGTAIEVLARMERLLTRYSPDKVTAEEPGYDQIRVRRLSEADLIDEAFTMIARDGAGMVEVSSRLLGSLRRLARGRDPELSAAARELAKYALAAAEVALDREHDLKRLHAAVEGWGGFGREEEKEPMVIRKA